MPNKVIMPRVTMTMVEGVVAEWHKKVGDAVIEGEPLLDVETDKVVETLNAPYSGILLEIKANAGDVVPIEETIALIGAAGEEKRAAAESSAVSAATVSDASAAAASAAPGTRVPATPLAKKLAADRGIPLVGITGTGVRNMITRADVLAAGTAPTAPAAVTAAQDDGEDLRIPFTGIRARIAEKMMESKRSMADVTTFAEVDLTAVKTIRKHLKISYTVFAVRAAALALRDFPMINAQIDGEFIVQKKHINVNVGVATDRGLLTPVIRDADRLNLLSVGESIADLASRGRVGKLTVADMQEGTFTVTNSGTFGSLFFTPIINAPQCAILGMGKTLDLAVFNDKGEVVPKTIMVLALSYDHRIVDGETSVKFLQKIKYYMENPSAMLYN